MLSRTNSRLKSELIFPLEVVGKFSCIPDSKFKSAVVLCETEDLLQMLIPLCDLAVMASGRYMASGLPSFIAE